jgi:hypothetical protein
VLGDELKGYGPAGAVVVVGVQDGLAECGIPVSIGTLRDALEASHAQLFGTALRSPARAPARSPAPRTGSAPARTQAQKRLLMKICFDCVKAYCVLYALTKISSQLAMVPQVPDTTCVLIIHPGEQPQ